MTRISPPLSPSKEGVGNRLPPSKEGVGNRGQGTGNREQE